MKIAKVYQIEKNIEKEFGEFEIASDKSILKWSAIFSLLTEGENRIKNYLQAEDTLNSLKIVEKLGAKVTQNNDEVIITSSAEINEPDDILDCGYSGTAMRLFTGLLAPQDGICFVLTGDKYLRSRPMKRVTEPLNKIGAKIDGREDGNLAPLFIRGTQTQPFDYESKIASAQVKSAMILTALFGIDVSAYKEPELSRDHTEKMLKGMGAGIEKRNGKILIRPLFMPLKPLELTIPTDPSSAFFFAVATAIIPNSKTIFKNILLNKTRIEAFEVLKRMGAKIEFIVKENKYEKIGDIIVEAGELKAVEVSEKISWLIDEIPALAIAMSVAKGKSVVKNAKELRVKESDRINSVVVNLRNCGIEVEEFEDGFAIQGGTFQPAIIDSFGDHRIAMSFAIAGLLVGMKIEDVESVNTSFPNFFDILAEFTKIELETVC